MVLALALLFLGCQQQNDIGKLKAQVQEINDALVQAIMENDNESVFKFYTEDAISLPSYQPMMKGLSTIKEASKNQPQMKMTDFTLTTSDVFVSGDFIVEIGTYSLNMEMPEAPGEVVTDKGKYLTLFEIQKDGSLKIKAETWNTDMNPWETMMQEHEEMMNEESK